MSEQVEFSFVSNNSQAIREISRLEGKLDSLERRILKTAGVSRGSSSSFNAMGGSAAVGGNKVRGLGDACNRAASTIKITGSNAGSAASLLNRLGIAASAAGQQMAGASRQAGGLSSGLGAVKAGIAGIGLGAAVTNIVQTTAAFKGFNSALTIVLGSQKAAASEMAFVKATANEAGFVVRDLAAEYVKLTAASKGTALEGRNTRAIFASITQAGAAYNLTSEQMAGALTAIQQMMSKGKVSAEELRGQLGERLPGAFQIAARSMGLTTQQLDKMLESGKLMATDFLPKFAAQLRKEIPAGTQTATAGFARFQTQLDEAKVAIGSSGFFDALAASAEQLAGKLRELSSDGSLQNFGKFLGDVTNTIVTLLPYVKPLVAGFVAYKVAAIAATIATTGLTRAMMLNPALAIAVGVAALVVAIDDLSASADAAAEANGDYKASSDALQKSQEQHEKIIRDLSSATDGEREATRKAAIQARDKAAADIKAARAALARAQSERELTAAMGAKAVQQAMMDTRGAGGGYDPALGAMRRQDKANKQAEANQAQAEKNLKDAQARFKALDAAINASSKDPGTGGGTTPGGGSSDKKRRGRSGGGAKSVDDYAQELKRLKAELADLSLTEEERKLAEALESAGLERNIKLTGEKADKIRDLVKQISDAEKAKQYQEALKELDESYKALTLSETQLAQVEARRRAGLPTDLAIQTEQTKKVDEYAEAIRRATKAAQDAQAAKNLSTDIQRAERDSQLEQDLATGKKKPEDVEYERQINAIMDERAAQLQQINEMEVITLEQRAQGMKGITAEEKEALAAAAERLAVQRETTLEAQKQAEEIKRQTELSEQISDFLVDLWENPKEAMKRFFQDLMKRLLAAIIKAALLGEKLGGSGGIGGLIGNAVIGAITGGRARGGSVMAGRNYLVGENGPEVVRFGAAAQVYSHDKVFGRAAQRGGSLTLAPTYNIQLSGNAQQDSRTLAQIKMEQARQSALMQQEINKKTWRG